LLSNRRAAKRRRTLTSPCGETNIDARERA
jgi:hypothetical protein